MIMEKGIWIPVEDHVAEIMPNETGEIWVTRCGMGAVWVQKIYHHKEYKKFHWNGIKAWMPFQTEKPKPYKLFCANPTILDWKE